MEKYKLYRIHFIYTIGILILSIIGLMTVKWGQIPKLVEYITFALTLTSLTLSLLAIIYSLVSNGRLSESIGSLDSVTKDVLSSSSTLSEVTKELDRKVDDIPQSLKTMEERTEKTHKLIEEIQTTNQSMVEKEYPKEEVVVEEEELSNVNIESFAKYTSFTGKKFLYASLLSMKTVKGFSIMDMFGDLNHQYMNVFLLLVLL